MLTSPRDEAASRAFLREDFRLYGAKSALDKLAHDEAVSNSYESTGTLAVALLHRGDTCGAHSLFQRCLALAPERREAAERIGQMSLDLGRYIDAAAVFGIAAKIEPNNTDLVSQWLFSRYRAGDSTCYGELLAVAERGNRLQAWLNVGMAAVYAQRWDDASRFMCKAAAIFPDSAAAWSKSAIPALCSGEFLSAKQRIVRSLAIDGEWMEARVNLGRVLECLGDYRGAVNEYESALRLRQDLAEPRLNAGTCYLGLGHFEQGWAYYSARWSTQSVVNYGRDSMSRQLHTKRPRLEGHHPAARILVWTEQGIGDEIMFCSMLGELQARATELFVTVDDRLLALFSRSFPGISFFSRGQDVPAELYDYHLPMGDLGGLFRPSASRFAGRGAAYLKPDPSRVQAYKARLSERGKLLVGFSWYSANPNTGSLRSLALERLVRTLDHPQVKLVCLQYGAKVGDEVRLVSSRTGISIECVDELDLTHDLDGVAALALACDLVVSVGNAVAHLSAACGVRTWLLAAVEASWRWMFEGQRTPWYDSVVIYRQQTRGDWDDPLDRISSNLQALIKD
ncbi:MAG: hypothetical protein FJ184_09440 [Gammaproteobacteria bacterium]|nr:hypothetical protein [Gammaproteobacteria bacterium]